MIIIIKTWCLSAMGLNLLRTIKKDYYPNLYSSQLIPCCGHFIIPNKNDEHLVEIIGCPTGIDFKISHKKDSIFICSENGSEIELSKLKYYIIIWNLILEIEKFYGDPKLKKLPKNNFESEGFLAFWNEWIKAKNELNQLIENK